MNEHNQLQQTGQANQANAPINHTHNDSHKQIYGLTQADLPVLALSLASNILSYHQSGMHTNHDIALASAPSIDTNTHNIQSYNDHSNAMFHNEKHQQQTHLLQSINMAKNSFKSRLEQDSLLFEQHQQRQQVTQRQISQHQGIEI